MDTGTLIVGIGVVAGYWRANAGSGGDSTRREQESGAIETRKERYVDGDFDAVEFEKRLETLYEDDANGVAATRESPSNSAATTSRTTTGERADRQPSDERASRRNRTPCSPGRNSRRRSKKRAVDDGAVRRARDIQSVTTRGPRRGRS
ncbi:MAG: hypothetical protein ACOCSF_07375 [Halanaeroarchaeum sp.]